MMPGSELSQTRKICFVALGSNLGDSREYVTRGTERLAHFTSITGLQSSSLYQSKPVGPQDQPDYINSVVRFETDLEAEELLDIMQAIENENNRIREGVVRWGARTLDLDLLLYADEIITNARLQVPHPHLCNRAFVLLPLAELQHDLKIPGGSTIEQCIKRLSTDAIQSVCPLA